MQHLEVSGAVVRRPKVNTKLGLCVVFISEAVEWGKTLGGARIRH